MEWNQGLVKMSISLTLIGGGSFYCSEVGKIRKMKMREERRLFGTWEYMKSSFMDQFSLLPWKKWNIT